MQGILPCHNNGDCPYGQLCDVCPELKARAEGLNPKNSEKGGFYSREIVKTKGPDGKEHFAYSHPE